MGLQAIVVVVVVVVVINEDTLSLASCKRIGGRKSLLLSSLAEDPIPILLRPFGFSFDSKGSSCRFMS